MDLKNTKARLGTIYDSNKETKQCVEFMINEPDTPDEIKPELQVLYDQLYVASNKLRELGEKVSKL